MSARTRYEKGRGAILCRWLGHSWRATSDPITARPIKVCVRCPEVSPRTVVSQRGSVDWGLVGIGAFLLGIVVLIASFVVYTVAGYHHKQDIVCTVVSKDRTSDGKGNSDARIYTKECGVLKVGDATFIGHFNSADTYSQIQAGHVYEFHTIGFRVPFLSDFPNIVQVAEVSR